MRKKDREKRNGRISRELKRLTGRGVPVSEAYRRIGEKWDIDPSTVSRINRSINQE